MIITKWSEVGITGEPRSFSLCQTAGWWGFSASFAVKNQLPKTGNELCAPLEETPKKHNDDGLGL